MVRGKTHHWYLLIDADGGGVGVAIYNAPRCILYSKCTRPRSRAGRRRLATQTGGDKPIITAGLCYQPIVMVDPFIPPVYGTNRW